MSFAISTSLSALNALAPPSELLLLKNSDALVLKPAPPQSTCAVVPPNITVRLPPTAENPPPSPVNETCPAPVPTCRVNDDRPFVPSTTVGPVRRFSVDAVWNPPNFRLPVEG